MSQLIIILGASGGGKSRSLIDRDPKKTFLFNTIGKDLPFPGSRGMYINGRNMYVPDLAKPREIPSKIINLLHQVDKNAPSVDMFVIEDYQYLMVLDYIQGEKNNEGWEKFTSILIGSADIFTTSGNLRKDLTVVIFAHTEEDKDPINGNRVQMKTVGKAFREKWTPEGFTSIVLITDPIADPSTGKMIYRFRTQTNGYDPVKSPEEMFPLYIPNNMDLVQRRLKEYYELGTSSEGSEVLKKAEKVLGNDKDSFFGI